MTASSTGKGDKRSEAAPSAEPVDDGIAVGVPAFDDTEFEETESDATLEEAAAAAEAALLGKHVAADTSAVATVAAERDEYLDSLQRLQADFENYRKRVQRQQEEQSSRAARDLVGKLLPVLDTLDLALAHVGEDAGSLEQARVQLLDVLVKEGLSRVDEVEVVFDPEVHDAVAHAEPEEKKTSKKKGNADDAEDEPEAQTMVDGVLRAGYRWQGNVVRPAMVRVRG